MGRISTAQNPHYWLALFPNGTPVIDGCEFIFDPDERDYDWFAVYEDLMYPEGSTKSERSETLSCFKENTLLVTQEPSSIKIYGPKFLAQYGHVLSAQPKKIVAHKNHILEVAPIRWFYGRPLSYEDQDYTTVDELCAITIPDKNQCLSTVCSDKQMTKSLKARFEFTKFIKESLDDTFTWYGRGVMPLNDKADAMNSFKYHIAVENDVFPHYWTEKIADSFLAYCLPFYHGPKNITEYFSPKSFIPIDIYDPRGSLEIIKAAISGNVYEDYLPHIKKARDKVLTDYNIMNTVARLVKARNAGQTASGDEGGTIYGRHAFRKKHPLAATYDALHRLKYEALFKKHTEL